MGRERQMKAVQYVEHGGPEVLRVVDVEEPHAGPGQVRIGVKAVGVNPVDWKLRQGLLPSPLPRIPGSDVAGARLEWPIGGIERSTATSGGRVSRAQLTTPRPNASRHGHDPPAPQSGAQAEAVCLQRAERLRCPPQVHPLSADVETLCPRDRGWPFAEAT